VFTKAESVTFSPNGIITLGVIPGTWSVGPTSDDLIARGYAAGGGTNVTLTVGQAVPANFIVQAVTAHCADRFRTDPGYPFPILSWWCSHFRFNPAACIVNLSGDRWQRKFRRRSAGGRVEHRLGMRRF